MSKINVFKHYKQTENQFTNSLLSILELSKVVDDSFIPDFFSNCLQIKLPKSKLNFKVLREQEGGHADAQISNDKLYLLVESKINSRSLRKVQIKSHLKNMKKKGQKLKRLILLTPDSDESWYIKQFRIIDHGMLYHLSWKRVYEHLENYANKRDESLFVKLILQYLSMIKERILDQEFIGVIQKLPKNHPDYLDEMRRGKRKAWGQPRYRPELDGHRRKLILYYPEKEALTGEGEIKKLEKMKNKSYPYRYIFIPKSFKIYDPPISLRQVERIEGFETFGKGRSPIWKLTHEQYDELMKDVKSARK